MNLANIETFLCVARHQSLSVAASSLYISQPTVSSRIQQLEEELGVLLLHRKKGVRNIELTPEGLAFLPLAERWMALDAETRSFARQQFVTSLTIAGMDSLNVYLLQPLYKRLAGREYGLSLRILAQQSSENFSLVENREADIGFAFHLSRSSNVVCKPLLSEAMVLLCSSAGAWPDRPLSPGELDPRLELFVSWSQDYQLWHDSWWSPSLRPYVQINPTALIAEFMDRPGAWAICPATVAGAFLDNGVPAVVRELTDRPPDRVCYMLTERQPQRAAAAAAVAMFQKKLLEYLRECSDVVKLLEERVL